MAKVLARIVEIFKVRPIKGSDDLKAAEIVGRDVRVVVNNGDFHESDLAVYIENGSMLPSDDERYESIRNRFGGESGAIHIIPTEIQGVKSDGILIQLYKFIGKEIFYENRPATPEDVETEDGTQVTQEDIEGLMISTLFYRKEENGENGVPVVKKVEVGVGSDLTELLHIKEYQ